MTNRPSHALDKPLAPSPGAAAAEGGMTRRKVLTLLAALGVPASVVAQDPVKVAPKTYRVLLENDSVRAIEYLNRPGLDVCGSGRHYHPAHVTVMLTDVKFRAVENGKTTVGSLKAGDVLFFEEQWHEVENIDRSASRAYLVELKSANWKPSSS